jgi:hypothetical protein
MTAEVAPYQAGPLNAAGPVAYVESATAIAEQLATIIERQHLYQEFPDRKGGVRRHVTIEGWTLLAAMCRVYVDIEWTKYDVDTEGWSARARPHVMGTGEAWGAVDAQCSPAESNWRGRDAYAIRSMAQTRAISKALRVSPIGGIVALAGFDATPAEEMTVEAPAPRGRPANPGRRKREAMRAEIVAAAKVRGMGAAAIADLAADAGVTGGEATLEQMAEMLRRIEAHPILDDPAAAEAEAQAEGEGGYA